ncbi:MAG: MFS transporter [Oscillospiraceae bacterium]
MASYYFMNTAVHFLIIAVLLGLGYGILQPLFQSLVTGTTPIRNRGTANATYMLSYDIGIGIGSLCMGFVQNTIGLSAGFALTAAAYVAAGLIFCAIQMVIIENYFIILDRSNFCYTFRCCKRQRNARKSFDICGFAGRALLRLLKRKV